MATLYPSQRMLNIVAPFIKVHLRQAFNEDEAKSKLA